MTKDKTSPEEKDNDVKQTNSPQVNVPGIFDCVKDMLPDVIKATHCERNSDEYCEVNIRGTPEMILKILKVQ